MKERHDETPLRPTLPNDDERASVLLCSAYLHRQENYPLPAHVGKESSEVHLPFILFADVREVEKLVPSLIILDLKVGSDNQGMLRLQQLRMDPGSPSWQRIAFASSGRIPPASHPSMPDVNGPTSLSEQGGAIQTKHVGI